MNTAEASRLYRARHPERIKARNASPNARAARARYEKSDKCVAYRASYAGMYEQKPERIEAKRLYRQSPKGRAGLRRASRKAELRKLGIDERHYQKLLNKQKGVCAICSQMVSATELCVDHCHITGKIRGLLCHTCNLGIGNFMDDPNILRRAISYLEE